MAFALDTNILIYAVASLEASTPEATASMIRDSKRLVQSLQTFWISPITELELLPYLSAEQAGFLRLERAQSLRVDSVVVRTATDMLRSARRQPDRCQSCFITQSAKKCGSCGRVSKNADVVNDAVILAGAEAEPRVTALYSFDGDMTSLANSLTLRISVLRPEDSNGALFARARTASSASDE